MIISGKHHFCNWSEVIYFIKNIDTPNVQHDNMSLENMHIFHHKIDSLPSIKHVTSNQMTLLIIKIVLCFQKIRYILLKYSYIF